MANEKPAKDTKSKEKGPEKEPKDSSKAKDTGKGKEEPSKKPPSEKMPVLPKISESFDTFPTLGSTEPSVQDLLRARPASNMGVGSMDYHSPLSNCYADRAGPSGYRGGACGPNSMGFCDWGDQMSMDYDYDDSQNYDTYDDYDQSFNMDTCTPRPVHSISDSDNEDTEEGEVQDDGSDSDLLKEYRDRYADEDGPPIKEDIAKVVNAMWKKGRDPERAKELYKKYPRPANIQAQKVDINEEVMAIISKKTKTKDITLRAVQTAISKATIPALNSAVKLMDPAPLNRQRLFNMALDSVTMLGHANAIINQIRRDAMKPDIIINLHGLCRPSSEVDTAKHLFGEGLVDRIKAASQGQRFGRRGRGGFRGGRGHNNRWNPYQSRRGGFRGNSNNRPFLGKPYVMFKYDNVSEQGPQMAYSMHQHDNDSVDSKYFIASCRPGPQLQGSRPQRGPAETVTQSTSQKHDEVQVGEYSFHPIITQSKWPKFVAGRVSLCTDIWRQLSSDSFALRQLRGYTMEFDELPQQNRIPHELRFSEAETKFLRQEIQNLLDKQVITEVDHVDGEFISTVFLREKKVAGTFRMILNLKKLNESIEKKHFKMDTLLSTLALITPGCYMLSLDFKDAYYSLRVAPQHRKFLRFQFEGKLYEFTCMAMGMSAAPRVFTKLLKIPLTHLRNLGYTIAGYSDDQPLIENSAEEAFQAWKYAAKLFEDLGFTINVEKSVVVPTQTIEHLGFIIDSRSMTVTMTPEKTMKIRELILECLQTDQVTIRQVARLLGKFNATGPANPWALLYSKNMERDKNWALSQNRFDFEATMTLSDVTKSDLQWWLTSLPHLSAPIRTPKPDKVISTDASLMGWGCHDPDTGRPCGGRWSLQESQNHINVLELKAVLLSLQSVCRNLNNCHVRVMSDNTTTVASINKQGSTQSRKYNEVARHIWDFAVERQMWVSAAHCPGVLNCEADTASRKFSDETEWSLNQSIFQRICDRLGTPNIDLFASRLNYKLKPYCAWQPDPEAYFIDALKLDWGGLRVYGFPPFAVIHLMLQKFIQDEAEGILIVPFWPSKPWFTQFANLIVNDPIIIPVTDNVLFQPFSLKKHPMVGNLTLVAAHCSTDIWRNKEYRQRLIRPSYRAGELHLNSFIHPTYKGGHCFVSKGKLIQCRPL